MDGPGAEKAERDKATLHSSGYSRINSDKSIYYPELDGLRFFAFLLVFVHHHPWFANIPYLSVIKTYGWIGVDIFFTLSAYLLSSLLIVEFHRTRTINIRNFYIRRIFRIWPAYLLFVIGSALLFWVILGGGLTESRAFRLMGLLTFTDNLFVAFAGYNSLPFTPHLWTIAYEEQFYVLIPIVVLFLKQRPYKVKITLLLITLILGNVIRIILIEKQLPPPAIWVLPFTHFESILGGIVLGFGSMNFLRRNLHPNASGLLGILCLIGACLIPIYNQDAYSYGVILSYTMLGLGTTLTVYTTMHSRFLKQFLSGKVLVFLGKRSYGLYLYHLLSIGMADYLIRYLPGSASNQPMMFFYSFFFTILLAVFSYRMIETPFLKWKKRFEAVPTRPI